MGALIGSIEMIINNIRRKGIAYVSKHHPSAKLKTANIYRVSSTDTTPRTFTVCFSQAPAGSRCYTLNKSH